MQSQGAVEERFLSCFRDEANVARHFPGQLSPEFQQLAAAAHAGVPLEECHFYHTVDLPGGVTVPGAWDLRPGVRQYLGHLDLAGQRVLELGPATGYLGFHMESAGAAVTAFDIAPFLPQDLVPLPGMDLEQHRRNSVGFSRHVRNAWWYCHGRLGSKVQAVYGDIYRLPPDIGRFDVATFGSILLHLANPFAAVREAAGITDKAIVITDMVQRMPVNLAHSYLEFNPGDMPENLVNWWWVTPGAAVKMLRVLGFPAVSVHFHEQKLHPHHDTTQPQMDMAMYTAVGQRRAGLVPVLPLAAEAAHREAELRAAWTTDREPAPAEQLEQARAELRALYASHSWRATRPLRELGGLLRRLRGRG